MLDALNRWRLQRKLEKAREKLAGKEAALTELRRCGHGNYGIAEDAGALRHRVRVLEQEIAALGVVEVQPVVWPEPVAHVHSNGEFCADRQITSSAMPGNLWPISLYTEEQVRELLSASGVALPATGWKADKLGSSLAWPADTSTDADGVGGDAK